MVKGILHSQHTLMMKLARCDKLLQQSTKVIGVHCWLMLAWLFVKSCSQKCKKNFSLDVFQQEKAKTKILTVLKRMQQEGKYHGLIQNMKLYPDRIRTYFKMSTGTV